VASSLFIPFPFLRCQNIKNAFIFFNNLDKAASAVKYVKNKVLDISKMGIAIYILQNEGFILLHGNERINTILFIKIQ